MENETQYNKRLFKSIPIRKGYEDKIIDISGGTIMMDLKTDLISDGKYKHFICIKNITNNLVEAQPLQTKTAIEVIHALNTIFKRRLIKKQSIERIITDMGSEFINKYFKQWCDDNQIILIPYNKYHYNSTANIERTIGVITEVIHQHLNKESLKLRRRYNRWVGILPKIIDILNEHAEQKYTMEDAIQPAIIHPKPYNIGLKVHKKIQIPVHLFNDRKKFKFRNSDKRFTTSTYTITDIRIRLHRPIRYILNNDESISYAHHELLPAKQ